MIEKFKKGGWFLLSGSCAVAIDYSTFLIINFTTSSPPWLSKLFSYLAGTIFSFIFNGKLTFDSSIDRKRLRRHLLLYSFSLLMNILVLQIFIVGNISFIHDDRTTGFLIATLASMTINYVGMSTWVFANRKQDAE